MADLIEKLLAEYGSDWRTQVWGFIEPGEGGSVNEIRVTGATAVAMMIHMIDYPEIVRFDSWVVMHWAARWS